MSTHIPRQPENYEASIHLGQRVKYRKYPLIQWDAVGDTIKNGELKHTPAHGEDRYAMRKWQQTTGQWHLLYVIVDVGNYAAVTSYCQCHDEDLRDCHEIDPNRTDIPEKPD